MSIDRIATYPVWVDVRFDHVNYFQIHRDIITNFNLYNHAQNEAIKPQLIHNELVCDFHKNFDKMRGPKNSTMVFLEPRIMLPSNNKNNNVDHVTKINIKLVNNKKEYANSDYVPPTPKRRGFWRSGPTQEEIENEKKRVKDTSKDYHIECGIIGFSKDDEFKASNYNYDDIFKCVQDRNRMSIKDSINNIDYSIKTIISAAANLNVKKTYCLSMSYSTYRNHYGVGFGISTSKPYSQTGYGFTSTRELQKKDEFRLKSGDYITICVDHKEKCLYFLKNGKTLIGKDMAKANINVNGHVPIDLDNCHWFFALTCWNHVKQKTHVFA